MQNKPYWVAFQIDWTVYLSVWKGFNDNSEMFKEYK